MGAMIESNLLAGSQPFPQPIKNLRRGVSIKLLGDGVSSITK
jgi:3-deoxy-D-arabino-heptulosonate 7-phosphate (DAHP) synthase